MILIAHHHACPTCGAQVTCSKVRPHDTPECIDCRLPEPDGVEADNPAGGSPDAL